MAPATGSTGLVGQDVSNQEPKPTTTISTIAIKAGDVATMVVALLKCDGHVELRVDEMNPRLLEIGRSVETVSTLINIHDDMIKRLRDKEDQVNALLSRADALGAEKTDPDETIVYDAMAKSLTQAWRELNRQLMLRGYLLRETLSFYRMARHHEQLTTNVSDCLRRALAGGPDAGEAIAKVELLLNEVIDTTATAVDLGSSVIAQIRALGQIDDNPERGKEILDACFQIENVMLGIASEWERVEQTWRTEKLKITTVTETVEETFGQIEEWLRLAERKVKALNEVGVKRVLEEGNAHKARLLEMGSTDGVDGSRVAHLSGQIEEFLHYLKTRMGRSQRIQAFFTASQSMLSQLKMMAADMENANAAMAGELAPLAKQKAAGVIHEGKDIAAKEILSHEEQRLVKNRVVELESSLADLERLAKERREVVEAPKVSNDIQSLQLWMFNRGEPFLAQNGEMGNCVSDARDFVDRHRDFAQEVVNYDATVESILKRKSQTSEFEQNILTEYETKYEKLKDVLENRIQLGNTYEQVHKFARDLESSFDALTSLLDTNRDFTNERVAAQMTNVFQMIQDTISQEKHQVEKFIGSADQVGRCDKDLNVKRAIESARNLVVDHEHRFTYITAKWMEWQQSKAELRKLVTTIEEIQMWQEEAVEIIRLLQKTNITSKQENEDMHKRVQEFRQTVEQQKEKLRKVSESKDEQITRRASELVETQNMIEAALQNLEKKVETVTEHFAQQDVIERIRAPQILTELKDAQVDEGSRFEFAARIEGEPEPRISWLKDGIDVKSNMDYRQDYINGIASLVIEETFIEDTATYTVRAQNKGGSVESSARLVVKSRSAISSLLEEDKPRFVMPLRNVAVNEGETAKMQCVIVGKPEPEVVWYKEEQTLRESERVQLEFTGDKCSVTIRDTIQPDTGLYTAKAKNVLGETTSFCQLKVVPKKQPPPPPPKPASRPPSVVQRPPSIQPALTNTSWTEGDTAILQVLTQGEPRPQVQWYRDQIPVQETKEVHIEEKSDGWSRLIISPVSPAHSGLYTVIAENEAGEAKTGATLQVNPSVTTTEHMYQTDMYEQIMMQPVARTEERTDRKTYEEHGQRHYQQEHQFPMEHELSTIQNEKRWVDIIDETFSQHSTMASPIPQVQETKKTTVTEQRWVDEIDEMLGQPKLTTQEREVKTAESYVRMVDEMMKQTMPQAVQEAAVMTKSQEMEYAGQIHRVEPEVRRGTTTPSSKMFNVATIRMSPQPEVRSSTVTQGAVTEHAAISRRTPVPEAHHGTVTSAGSVENIAAIRQSPVPEKFHATTTQGAALENIAAIRQSPVPEKFHASTTQGAAVENIAAIRQSPVPEKFHASTTQGAAVENIAAIRQTPVTEQHRATTTTKTTVESAATIRKTPVPETHRASITSEAPAVGNIAAIQRTAQPETFNAQTTEGVRVSNIAQVHAPSAQPDKQQITKEVIRVDRVDDVLIQPFERNLMGDVKQTVTEEGFVTRSQQDFDQPEVTTTVKKTTIQEDIAVDRKGTESRADSFSTVTVIQKEEEDQQKQLLQKVQQSPVPQRKFVPQTTTTTTHSGEGWVQEVHDEIGQPSTTVTRNYKNEESLDVRGQQLLQQRPGVSVMTTKREDVEDSRKVQKTQIPRMVPQTTTTTTESGEGWVQEVHDEIGKPTTTVVRTYKEEESLDARGKKLAQQTHIPRMVPQTTTTTTESGEGWVQEVHDEMGKPTTTVVRTYKEEESLDARGKGIVRQQPGVNIIHTRREDEKEDLTKKTQLQSRIPVTVPTTKTTVSSEGWVHETHDEAGRPTVTSTRKYTDEELEQIKRGLVSMPGQKKTEVLEQTYTEDGYARSEVSRGQRDSYLLASDAEGFWTDGAYTGSPTPPPSGMREQSMMRQDIGQSRSSTEPEFIRTFQKDYTVEEGESITIECVLVGNPRPKVRFFFNDRSLQMSSEFCKISVINDTHSIIINNATLNHAGYYKICAENKKGYTESLTIVHVRPKALGPVQKIVSARPTEHTTRAATGSGVTEEFAMFEYEQHRPQKHGAGSRLITPPPAKRQLQQVHKRDEEHLEQYDIQEQRASGHPPHFTQTLISAVAADGDSARFEGIVTGWPAPTVEWTKDGVPLSKASLPAIQISNIGGRVSLSFENCTLVHSGKYMCTAKNASGVATSSAQLVVRPKTIAPDFIQRLISEETIEGEQLKWTVRVTGDPKPKLTWLRDGIEIPNCEEVRLIDEGNGMHSLLIIRVECADSGQFTCLAENVAGEARSTADLVVRSKGSTPGNYFHVTKVTQEKQVTGQEPVRNSAFSIETPRQSAML